MAHPARPPPRHPPNPSLGPTSRPTPAAAAAPPSPTTPAARRPDTPRRATQVIGPLPPLLFSPNGPGDRGCFRWGFCWWRNGVGVFLRALNFCAPCGFCVCLLVRAASVSWRKMKKSWTSFRRASRLMRVRLSCCSPWPRLYFAKYRLDSKCGHVLCTKDKCVLLRVVRQIRAGVWSFRFVISVDYFRCHGICLCSIVCPTRYTASMTWFCSHVRPVAELAAFDA
jgi:hypothetical protein